MSKMPVRDCHCRTHEGLHWLHMDRLTRAINNDLRRLGDEALARGDGYTAWLAYIGYARAEMRRLSEKAREMLIREGV